jgi:NAD(P)-dependent dehydrogenase (short-subunit alcohol dehydrogenase family)
MELQEQTALVTGGAKGIGRAISMTLAQAGADVTIAARDVAAMEALATELRAFGRKVLVIKADVTKPREVEAAVARMLREMGNRIDILVNVAGIPGPIETPVQAVDPDAFNEVMRVNVAGTFLPIKYAAPSMIARQSGRIINIGSNSGTGGYPNRVGYAASKWAVRGLTRTVALELGRYNITVNCVNPGIVDGARMQRLCRERASVRGVTEDVVRKEYSSSQAVARITTEEDVAAMVLLLAGKNGQSISGQDLDIDGGWKI